MFDAIAFQKGGVKQASAHSVVVRDQATQVAIVVVRRHGEFTEVLTPDHPEFVRTVRLLESASKLKMDVPTDFKLKK